jgi:ATP-binding cassette subfamily B (MDR/TAP) protein 1
MGYSQVHGLDYQEVFLPTLWLETLRLILSLLAAQNWMGCQVDFTTAFLNGYLNHEVFMEQPPGYEDSQHPDWVCQLDRSLYGLKQSPWQWNVELHKVLLDLGLTNLKYNPTLYFKIQGNKLIGALTTHVDNLAIVGEPTYVTTLIQSLGSKFKIGANEELHHFLSLKISHDVDNNHVLLNQLHYIKELGNRFLDGNHHPVSNPANTNFKNLCCKTPTKPPSPGPYNQIIGSLLWVSQCTCPDISFVVNRQDPGKPLYMSVTKNPGFCQNSYIFQAHSYTFHE